MGKEILTQYSDRRARVKLLREHVNNKQKYLDRLRDSEYIVGDTVTCGKRGKRSLGTVKIVGRPYTKLQKAEKAYEQSCDNLIKEEQELLDQMVQAEEYISSIEDVEIRNIMTLYHLENLNWVQVAHRMNYIYQGTGKIYTDSRCRQKHDRFLEKN